MAGEIDQHAIIRLSHAWQPFLQFLAHVRQRGVLAQKAVNVFRRELSAFRANQRGIHLGRVAKRELQLPVFRKVRILRDANHQRVAARNHYPVRLGRGSWQPRKPQIALRLRLAKRTGSGQQSQKRIAQQEGRVHLWANRKV